MPGVPAAPAHLSEAAKAAWKSLAQRLDEMGVLSLADGWALEQLAENYCEILECRALLKDGGRVITRKDVKGNDQLSTHPAVIQLSDAEKRFRAMMVEFGLTPSSRSRVKTHGTKEEKDPAAKYFA